MGRVAKHKKIKTCDPFCPSDRVEAARAREEAKKKNQRKRNLPYVEGKDDEWFSRKTRLIMEAAAAQEDPKAAKAKAKAKEESGKKGTRSGGLRKKKKVGAASDVDGPPDAKKRKLETADESAGERKRKGRKKEKAKERRLKLKARKEKKKRKKRKTPSDEEPEIQKDVVRFGEVAMQPPQFHGIEKLDKKLAQIRQKQKPLK